MVKYQDGIMKFKYNQPPTSVLRYGGLRAFFETKVLNQSSGIFSNFGAENPPHRKAEKRYRQFPYSKTELFLAANEEIFTILNNQMVKN